MERAYGVRVEVQGDAEITVIDGGDGSPIEVHPKSSEGSVERIFDQYYNEMRKIVAMLIILMILVVIALVLVRLPIVSPLLELLSQP